MTAHAPHPLATIVIPTFNRSAFLKQAVDSALAQTWPVEVIVVDDGSTDDTHRVLAGYGERVLALRQENAGVSAARNRGLAAASTPFISFLDDDDTILPEKIERQLFVLNARPKAGWVHCRHYYSDSNGTLLERIGLLPEGRVLAQMLCKNFIWMSAPLIRRQVLDQVGGFDPRLSTAADFDLWLRILQAGYPLACVQEPLGCYRIHPASMVMNAAKAEQEIIEILDRFFAGENKPVELRAVKQQSYALWRFWLGRRYFASGDGENGERNFRLAAEMDPRLPQNRDALAQVILDEMVDLRTPDPFDYLDRVLLHLPPAYRDLQGQRERLRSSAYILLGLREIARGQTEKGRRLLSESYHIDPGIVQRPRAFAEAVTAYAMKLPVDPQRFTREVFACLPPDLSALHSVRRRVESGLSVALGFEDFHNNKRHSAFRQLWHALLLQPSWVRNRGLLSALARSLPAFLAGSKEGR